MERKVGRWKEITKIRVEINAIETKEKTEKISETKTNRINKLLARHTKKIRKRIQINKIRTERGDVATDTKEIKDRKRLL